MLQKPTWMHARRLWRTWKIWKTKKTGEDSDLIDIVASHLQKDLLGEYRSSSKPSVANIDQMNHAGRSDNSLHINLAPPQSDKKFYSYEGFGERGSRLPFSILQVLGKVQLFRESHILERSQQVSSLQRTRIRDYQESLSKKNILKRRSSSNAPIRFRKENSRNF